MENRSNTFQEMPTKQSHSASIVLVFKKEKLEINGEKMSELRNLLQAVKEANIHLITQENLVDIIEAAINIKEKSVRCNCDNCGGR